MEIKKNKLVGDNVSYAPTTKTSGKYGEGAPDTIIIHYTGGNNLKAAVNWLNKKGVQASAHMVVGREGEVVQMADLNEITWHAGTSGYQFPDETRTTFNKYSIGIEIANDGYLSKIDTKYINSFKKEVAKEFVFEGEHRNYPRVRAKYWHTYTDEQIKAVYEICAAIIKEYPTIKYILGHEEIAPTRKSDPGPAFPLDDLRKKMKVWIPTKPEPEKIREKLPLGTVGIATTVINFRSGPATTYDTIAETVQKDEKVLVLSKIDKWYEVEQDIEGWVSKKFIDRDDSDSITDGIVNANLLNIRSKPEGDKIAKPLTKGHKVKIVDRDGEWYKVETRVSGWVYGKYIKIV
ncbi:MAG: N-acetylmuramoyl-L-alanine amidase [Bacteroidales bacterium]|nr:N-acetylmuramoyl-L-alanine amidase [Bacteroidales bacterium]